MKQKKTQIKTTEMGSKLFLPHWVVQEALGNFTLRGTEEEQICLAEQFASSSYSDLDSLVSSLQGYAHPRKFSKELKELKESKFFAGYWAEPSTEEKVKKTLNNWSKL